MESVREPLEENMTFPAMKYGAVTFSDPEETFNNPTKMGAVRLRDPAPSRKEW